MSQRGLRVPTAPPPASKPGPGFANNGRDVAIGGSGTDDTVKLILLSAAAAAGVVVIGVGAWFVLFKRTPRRDRLSRRSRSAEEEVGFPESDEEEVQEDSEEDIEREAQLRKRREEALERRNDEAKSKVLDRRRAQEGASAASATKRKPTINKHPGDIPDYGAPLSIVKAQDWLKRFRNTPSLELFPNAMAALLMDMSQRWAEVPAEKDPDLSPAELKKYDEEILALDYERNFILGFIAAHLKKSPQEAIPMVLWLMQKIDREDARAVAFHSLFLSESEDAQQLAFQLFTATSARRKEENYIAEDERGIHNEDDAHEQREEMREFQNLARGIFEALAPSMAIIEFGKFHATGNKEHVHNAIGNTVALFRALASAGQGKRSGVSADQAQKIIPRLTNGTAYAFARFKKSSAQAAKILKEIPQLEDPRISSIIEEINNLD